jgi:hypothetical protein
MAEGGHSVFDSVQQYLSDNPLAYGVVLLVLGLFFFLSSVFNWNWVFGGSSPHDYNTQKLGGIINVFGKRTAQLFFGFLGVVLIICSVIVILLSLEK